MLRQLDSLGYWMRVRVLRSLDRLLRLDWFMPSLDRRFLEDELFARFRSMTANTLSIGCHRYSRVYRHLLPKSLWATLDISPDNARYGAYRHAVGDCRRIGDSFPGEKFGIILFNGIIGYGIDTPGDFRDFLESAREALEPGGWLVIGYNDIPRLQNSLIEEVDPALFVPTPFPGVPANPVSLPTHNRHTFRFYRRSAG